MTPLAHRRRLLAAAAAGSLGLAAHAPHALALPARPLVFPQDHGAHADFRTEWWYITGHVQAGAREFGIQVTFFRSRPDGTAQLPGRFAARQLLFAHAAITDVAGRRLWHDQRIARWNGEPDSGPARAATGDLDVNIRDWRLHRTASGYAARLLGQDISLDLQFAPTQELLLQGEQGLSRKGPHERQASYYYSHPQLAASGTLTVRGERHRVQGRAWYDHEWSQELLDRDAVGWDWIGMNLDDGHCVTAFQLRRKDGSKLWAGGSFRAAGDARKLTPYRFRAVDVDFRPQRHWVSPATRARYPVEWLIRTPADFYTVRAVIDSQELDARGSTGTIYWEGLSDLYESNGKRVGRGYLEMTGYAGSLIL